MRVEMARLEVPDALDRGSVSGNRGGGDLNASRSGLSGGMELFLFSGSLLASVDRISKATGLERAAVICEALTVLEEKLQAEKDK